MLSRLWTVGAAVVLLVATLPVVWLIGYQDHPWRRTEVAVVVAAVAIVASLATMMAGRHEEPRVSPVLTGASVVVSVIALVSTISWVLLN